MERFDEPKPELKVPEEKDVTLTDAAATLGKDDSKPAEEPTPLASEPTSLAKEPAQLATEPTKLATEPAQLALTRAQLPPPMPPEMSQSSEGSSIDDRIADLSGLLKPLLILLLILGVPWIIGPVMDNNWTFWERSRAYSKADQAEQNGETEAALAWIKRGMAVLPPVENKDLDEHTKSRYAWSYSRLGQLHLAMGRVAEACGEFEMATKLSPDEVWIVPEYAEALTKDGRPDLALKALEAVSKYPKSEFDNNYLMYQRQLALAYNAVGRYREGLDSALRASISDDKWDTIRADILAGDALMGLDRYQEALQKYQSAANSGIDRNSKYAADYLRGGGIYYMDDGNQDFASTWLNGALRKARQYPAWTRYDEAAILNDLAKLDLMQNNPSQAIEKLQHATTFDRKKSNHDNLDYARDLYNLSFSQYAFGDKTAAISSITKCLEIRRNLLGEDNPLTQMALHQIHNLGG